MVSLVFLYIACASFFFAEISITGSIAALLIYFCILREENDVDIMIEEGMIVDHLSKYINSKTKESSSVTEIQAFFNWHSSIKKENSPLFFVFQKKFCLFVLCFPPHF